MNAHKHRWLLYVIIAVVVSTIAIQVYWNYKNYLSNKQQLINDVQTSLDKAVDDYYAEIAERTTVRFAVKGHGNQQFFNKNSRIKDFISQIEDSRKTLKIIDSLKSNHIDGVHFYSGKKADSILANIRSDERIFETDSCLDEMPFTSKLDDIKALTSKVYISINSDTLALKKVDSLLNAELIRKNINVQYKLSFKNAKDSIAHFNKFKILQEYDGKRTLKTFSKSSFLPKGSELEISFTNETKIILTRILGGILVSFILILAVIGCLFYLFKIIKQQKQLAEIKNDLISNITHEFKTPIATIGVAIESIKDFNALDNKEKTRQYLNMSNQQLSKLNLMVEKLLETATLDSDSLELNKEKHNINDFVQQIVDKHKIHVGTKSISFKAPTEEIVASIDGFHFENALNNILDNALKYGGDKITLYLASQRSNTLITISDNGSSLSKANKDKIFEKFYRVSQGNTHNIKGFGIGLYYTKSIIEKHNGNIHLDLNNNLTSFKISIPNE